MLSISLACVLFAATAQLNPTVRVLPKPQSIVPVDCDQGLAPASPRLPVEAPAEMSAAAAEVPPASDLRTRLRRIQSAAERGDHDAFKAALAEARSGLAAYPGGGEKQAASDVPQV